MTAHFGWRNRRIDTIHGGQRTSDHLERHAVDRNVVTNPEVLYQALAHEVSIIRAFAKSGTDPATCRVLDVGCGSGIGLLTYLRLGFPCGQLTGLDLLPDRLVHGHRAYPGISFLAGDGTALPFQSGTFQLTVESTMFWSIPDDAMAALIASEMLRVTQAGGALILSDWRIRDPRQSDGCLSRRRLRRLFPGVQLENVERGPLLPPVGRWMSRRAPSAYFLAQRCLPIATGMLTYTLRKAWREP